jgi:hypothetical protein
MAEVDEMTNTSENRAMRKGENTHSHGTATPGVAAPTPGQLASSSGVVV